MIVIIEIDTKEMVLVVILKCAILFNISQI